VDCDTYIDLKQNTRHSEGWNTGLKLSRGKYKVILGDDTIVHGDWLGELQKAMDMPQAGVRISTFNTTSGVGIVRIINGLVGRVLCLLINIRESGIF